MTIQKLDNADRVSKGSSAARLSPPFAASGQRQVSLVEDVLVVLVYAGLHVQFSSDLGGILGNVKLGTFQPCYN